MLEYKAAAANKKKNNEAPARIEIYSEEAFIKEDVKPLKSHSDCSTL